MLIGPSIIAGKIMKLNLELATLRLEAALPALPHLLPCHSLLPQDWDPLGSHSPQLKAEP